MCYVTILFKRIIVLYNYVNRKIRKIPLAQLVDQNLCNAMSFGSVVDVMSCVDNGPFAFERAAREKLISALYCHGDV